MLRYMRQLRRENPGDVISIVIPEYVVEHWWENLLHNQTALRLKGGCCSSPPSRSPACRWCSARGEDEQYDERLGHLRPRRGPARRLGPASAPARSASAGAASSQASRLRVIGLPLLTLLLEALDGTLSLESQVLAVPARGGVDRAGRRLVGRARSRRRRGGAHQLLLRRAGTHLDGRRSRPGRRAGRVRGRGGGRQRRSGDRRATRSGGRASAHRGGDALGARRPRARRRGVVRAVLERARDTFQHGVGRAQGAPAGGGEWIDVETSAGRPPGAEAPVRFDLPVGGDLRLVGRGPALFAEDQRVSHAFAGAAQTAYEGRPAERRGRERRATLEMVDRQRTALLAAVGHDLRTPLSGIKAAVSTLRQTDVEWSADERGNCSRTSRSRRTALTPW